MIPYFLHRLLRRRHGFEAKNSSAHRRQKAEEKIFILKQKATQQASGRPPPQIHPRRRRHGGFRQASGSEEPRTFTKQSGDKSRPAVPGNRRLHRTTRNSGSCFAEVGRFLRVSTSRKTRSCKFKLKK